MITQNPVANLCFRGKAEKINQYGDERLQHSLEGTGPDFNEIWCPSMVGEMVQNSQSLYSFKFTAVIVIHEYIYSHSTTKFTFKKYICLHLTTYFLFTNIFTHIYGMYSFTFKVLNPFTFTIQIFIQHAAIFIQHFLRTPFAHH